jgi:hypothetical protein
MRKGWGPAFLAIVSIGVAGLLLTAASDKRDLAFTLGVQPTQVAAVLKPNEQACQRPIYVPAPAKYVRFKVGTYGTTGMPLDVTTRAIPGGDVVNTGSVTGGYANNTVVRAPVAGVEEGSAISLCVLNRGARKVALYGGAPQAARTSAAFVDGRNANTDLTLIFERARSRSMFSALPDIFERAALWHPGWVGAWTFWLLLVLLLLGVPFLFGRALAAADQVPGGSYDSRP